MFIWTSLKICDHFVHFPITYIVVSSGKTTSWKTYGLLKMVKEIIVLVGWGSGFSQCRTVTEVNHGQARL